MNADQEENKNRNGDKSGSQVGPRDRQISSWQWNPSSSFDDFDLSWAKSRRVAQNRTAANILGVRLSLHDFWYGHLYQKKVVKCREPPWMDTLLFRREQNGDIERLLTHESCQATYLKWLATLPTSTQHLND